MGGFLIDLVIDEGGRRRKESRKEEECSVRFLLGIRLKEDRSRVASWGWEDKEKEIDSEFFTYFIPLQEEK
jgi:hypothetical protein